MPEAPAPKPPSRPITPLKTSSAPAPASDPPTVCDRCGAEMYRMHAVWRCPSCGFKT